MRHLRALPKILAFAVVTSVAYLFLLVSSFVIESFGRSTTRWRCRLFQVWARLVAKVIGMRVEVRGTPPESPFFLVSNHLGYVDVVLLASRLPCLFVARSDVARWPVFGRLCRSVKTLFIDRDNKRDIPRVIEHIEKVMREGPGIVVFPEGTSSEGSSVLSFKPSLLEVAARAELPVSYASLSYATPPGAGSARKDVCWWGGRGFAGHMFRLFQLPGIHATLEFGDESIRESDRKVLATRLWRAVVGQFRPVVQ